ncbi:MAG TPA: undecaprenyl-diphosphatase UppP, partial [Candidatus Limnocylindrales bacterium]|nr:undecaprenyl-diphosphatase UppP [Candidatus Limnocylindrales bacterium]
MAEILQAIVIGVVQGLTEFLPISSSAHLIVLPRILGWDDTLINSAEFVVMLHMGTLAALLAYFWRDVIVLIRAAWAGLRERSLAGDPKRKLAVVLLLSVIPAALFGLFLEDWIDSFFRDSILVVPVILVVGAAILWLAERLGRRERDLDRVELTDAAVIGVAQALALFPGISRSGITLAAGLFRGLEREAAARFAFLMGIPIIAGAGLWKTRSIMAGGAGDVDLVVLAAGVIAAAASGWLAIGFLLRYLRTHSTAIFIAYQL